MRIRSLPIRAVISLLTLSMLAALGVPSPAGAVDGTNTISTILGTGTAGDGAEGLGGPATAVAFPSDVAVNKDGIIYVADPGNNRVRQIALDGTVTTIAGTGTAGFSGDDGAGSAAQLDAPVAVAVDKFGVLYIADSGNNRIRKVALDGTISTVAGTGTAGSTGDGGQANLAQVNGPVALAVSKSGLVYFVDAASNKVRVIAADGVVSTFAGIGTAGYSGDAGPATSAELNAPQGLAVDNAGLVYIADTDNHRIRKVALDGTIITIAGTGIAGYNVAQDGSAATSAQLDSPFDVAVDLGQAVYISDSGSSRIRRISPAGIISTIAGSGASFADNGPAADTSMSGPAGMITDKHGNLYISDSPAQRVRKITQPDLVDPVVTITSPAPDVSVDIDEVVVADFACTDFYSGVDTCVATFDGKPIFAGDNLDTSSAGVKTLVVTGLDLAGNEFAVEVALTVKEPVVDSRILQGDYANSSGNVAAVARIYVAIMGRQPDKAGHDYWMSQMDSGKPLSEVAAFFIVSPEFVGIYGDATDSEFVDLLYRNVMQRDSAADPEGRAFWNDRLAGGDSRLSVTLFFSQSEEFKGYTQTS